MSFFSKIGQKHNLWFDEFVENCVNDGYKHKIIECKGELHYFSKTIGLLECSMTMHLTGKSTRHAKVINVGYTFSTESPKHQYIGMTANSAPREIWMDVWGCTKSFKDKFFKSLLSFSENPDDYPIFRGDLYDFKSKFEKVLEHLKKDFE